MAAEQGPALILMDIQLPGMNGIEALQRLRADLTTRAIPVIAVTASAMTQDRRQILAAGFDGYQAKPISVKGLLQNIREMLGARAMRIGTTNAASAGAAGVRPGLGSPVNPAADPQRWLRGGEGRLRHRHLGQTRVDPPAAGRSLPHGIVR